jgi:hypothetical protein
LAAVGTLTFAASARAQANEPNRFMMGDGRGYSAQVVALDLAGAASVPFILALSTAPDAPQHANYGWATLAMIPPTLTGPMVHLAHGRVGPAVISFVGWSSVVATSFGMAWVVYLSGNMGTGCATCRGAGPDPAWATGITIGAVGSALMTTLDAVMARSAPKTKARSSAFCVPYVAPAIAGASAGLSGSF